MHITLFGSAFNPPHLGHALIIQDFLEAGVCDQLWLLPANAHSFGKDMIEPHHRLEMTKLFLTSLPLHLQSKIKICPIEIDHNQTTGNTWDTHQLLQSKSTYLADTLKLSHDDLRLTDYSFLIGSDQLKKFHHWGNYQKLLKVMKFWVYPRADFPAKPLHPGMEVFNTPHQSITNISSTMVRYRLSQGYSLDIHLPTQVTTYITKHKLYS